MVVDDAAICAARTVSIGLKKGRFGEPDVEAPASRGGTQTMQAFKKSL